MDVMLEKSPGDFRIHRLCIVALQDSDFNQSNCLAIGRPVMHWLEDKQKIPSMQHGSRPAKLCISIVLSNFPLKLFSTKNNLSLHRVLQPDRNPPGPTFSTQMRSAQDNSSITQQNMGRYIPQNKDIIWHLRGRIH